jgi:hypothetical protein
MEGVKDGVDEGNGVELIPAVEVPVITTRLEVTAAVSTGLIPGVFVSAEQAERKGRAASDIKHTIDRTSELFNGLMKILTLNPRGKIDWVGTCKQLYLLFQPVVLQREFPKRYKANFAFPVTKACRQQHQRKH